MADQSANSASKISMPYEAAFSDVIEGTSVDHIPAKKEADVSIVAFVRPDVPGFAGVVKAR